jgi:pimeloyl-ACP methyl ester carboxylesterase
MLRFPTLFQSTAKPPAAGFTAERHTCLSIGYLRAGASGPPVILLHGWGAFKELWWSTLNDLGRDHRCFALDVPGHGDSALGTADSLSAVADAIGAFCDDLDLREIILVGHSMGGAVAAELAVRRPELVARLVLVDAAVDAKSMPSYSRTYLIPVSGWVVLRLAQFLGRTFMRPVGLRIPHEHGGGWILPWFRRSAYLSVWDAFALHMLLQALFSSNAADRLAEIRVPTLVINGQLDQLVTPSHSRRIAEAIPGARYVEIPGAMHNPMDERPRHFNRALREWLESAYSGEQNA